MDYFKIGGISWDVMVVEVSEYFNILYTENTGRTLSVGARMTLDTLGSFFGHKIVFAKKHGKEQEFDALYDFLSKPRYGGISVELPHNQTVLKYDAYVSNGERKLKKIDLNNETVYWETFTANFIPMEAQIKP